MSVLIKGMEMPTSCCECPLTYYEDGACIFTGIEALSIGVQKDCPLVPVPEHGPLVDVLDIINTFPDDYVFTNEQARALTNYIIRADPAEEGEG